uniref:OTU domain-containing protein n=1 Tax=Panagrolaimus superbus TaxID=310955 RepID=A0A914Z061_9BILA
MHGTRIDELFNPRKRCFVGGEINVSLEGKFAKIPKVLQFSNEDSCGNELDYLSFCTSKSFEDAAQTSSLYVSLKDVYFPPEDAWLRSKCYLLGIIFHENVSKFRPSIDDIQKFTIVKPDDVISVQGDGHCGYRSLSVIICGKQYYHNKIRRMICSLITQNNDPNFEEMYIFRNAKAIAYGKLQIDSAVDCEERMWMDDADLAAAANLFECNIFVLNSLDQWQCYGKKTFENGIMDSCVNFDPKLPTLLLQNSGGNHFSPVVNVRPK